MTKTFTIKNYAKKSTFSSFLPGISGVHGIPIWCYYVNRGQGVVSFGVEDKDHAIMEFYPAHQAYQNVKRTGFRTFIKKDGYYLEIFQKEDKPHSMEIGMNTFTIREKDEVNHLDTEITYFTLPGENVGALVRKITITNTDTYDCELEILDGMPACIPYGVDAASIKEMGQTSKAWMQVEDEKTNVPYYRVRVSMADTAAVSEVEGGNFSFACLADGEKLKAIVDPDAVFGYDNSLEKAVGFLERSAEELTEYPQVTANQLPCSFFVTKQPLAAKKSMTIYEVIGQVENKDVLHKFLQKKFDETYFDKKFTEAVNLTEELCRGIETHTGDERFDTYCKYTYLDNLLRGGYPTKLTKDKVFYLYSRKHGDLERDYNYFCMLPEFYTQGNGNFRDVNQNRRLDTVFHPFVGDKNIKMFYSLIQLDGYNPLAVEKVTYQLKQEQAEKLSLPDKVQQSFIRPFTPGEGYRRLEQAGVQEEERQNLFERILEQAEETVNGNFGEGYWCDHWTYNLDLIENYLAVFPEREKELLYDGSYTWFLSQININRRARRYVKTPAGIRQYHALAEESRRDKKLNNDSACNGNSCNGTEKLVRASDGEILYATLMEKLLLLCTTKYATLDSYGMGIEMEGGKPGWYDALNGMPGIFGSSMAETCELGRMLAYTIGALERYDCEVEVLEEIADLIKALDTITEEEKEDLLKEEKVMSFWNRINDAKEAYREKTFQGVFGRKAVFSSGELAEILKKWETVVNAGIAKAYRFGEEIFPTYFTYEVTDYEERGDGIVAKDFAVKPVPYFLEGPVRYLKLDRETEQKQKLYREVKDSDLYDGKLCMYKVNADLASGSYELGRARAFTPGWLENESVWLHMEYKYLLELLKSEMYEEFFADFKKAAIPFLDAEQYGRSIYENSSFIASSANPNQTYHGKGFVARLSGSTVEFLQMWQIMMFGKQPFALLDGKLSLQLSPALPEYLIGEEKQVTAMFLSKIPVTYHVDEKKAYLPGQYRVESVDVVYEKGSHYTITGGVISGKLAEDIREQKVSAIHVKLRSR